MANDQSKQLAIDVIARVDKLEKAMAKAKKTTSDNFNAMTANTKKWQRDFESSMASASTKAFDFSKSMLAVFGGAALLGGLAELPNAIREIVRGLGDLNDTADKVGMPVEQLEAFRYGAQLAGVEAANLDDGLQKFAKTIGEAGAKGNDFSKILAQNGIALKDANGQVRPLTELLADYADLIKNASSETDQMFLATTAFGRGGGDMVLMLKDGADGLARIQQAAKDAGVVLGNDLVKAAADVDDAFDKLAMQMKATLETEVVQGIQTVDNLIARFEALPGAIDGAWNSFEKFWNNLAGKSPADAATDKLKAAILSAQAQGSKPWENGFSVGDLDFGGAATKGDRLGAPPRKTVVNIPTSTGSKGSKAIQKTPEDAFQQDLQSIRDRTAAMREELATLGMTYEAQTKRKVALDLEQQALKDVREAARRKGDVDWKNAQLTPAQIAQIDAVADAYARQADELRKAQEAQELQRDVLKGAFDDLRSALDDGKLDWHDFQNIALNALDKVIDKIENDLIDALMQAGGGLGSLLGGSSFNPTPGGFAQMLGIPGYASGTRNHPGGLAIVGEKGPELVNLPRGAQVVPNSQLRMPSLQAPAAAQTFAPVVTFAPTIQMQGNGDAGEQVTAALKKFEKEFTPRVVKSLREAKTRGMV